MEHEAEAQEGSGTGLMWRNRAHQGPASRDENTRNRGTVDFTDCGLDQRDKGTTEQEKQPEPQSNTLISSEQPPFSNDYLMRTKTAGQALEWRQALPKTSPGGRQSKSAPIL